ncbi:MAG: hypothetical protein Q8N81_05995 [bacterium]|nr:hypothetical protein [bacterium]
MKKISSLIIILSFCLSPSQSLFAVEDPVLVNLSVYGNAPSAPSGLTATAMSCYQINLAWTDNSDNETDFAVERGPNGVVWTHIATTSANVSDYSNLGLPESATYYYRVRAYNAAGYSDYSGSASAVTPPCVTPPVCGNSLCETGEDSSNCPADCPAAVPAPGNGPILDLAPPYIYDLSVTATHNSALISWKTNELAQSVLKWGKTEDYELGSLSEISFLTVHSTSLINLDPETTYYFRIDYSDEARNRNKLEKQKFTTLVLPDTIPPANVSNFVLSNVDDKAIKLDWENPTDPDFNGVKIVKSTKFFPTSLIEGTLIYDGKGTSFTDNDVKKGVRYYYTIFSYDASGNYSSGAIGSMVIPKPGVPLLPPEFPPVVPPELVPPEIEKIQPEDFNFSQNGKPLAVTDGKIDANPNEPLKILLAYEKVPEVLKTILVTLTEPSSERKTFSFLLRANKEKNAYEAVLAPLKKPGLYPATISILDFKNQTLKKIKTYLLVQGGEIAPKQPCTYLYIWILPICLIVLLLILLAVMIFKRKRKKVQNNNVI